MTTKNFVHLARFWWLTLPCISLANGSLALNSTVIKIERIRAMSPACEGKVTITENDNETEISFRDVAGKRGDEKPFIRCRLLGELRVPRDYQTKSDVYVKAIVRGAFDQVGDQVGGRITIGFADKRETVMVLEKPEVTSDEHMIELNALLPSFTALPEDRILSVTMYFEGMINYQLHRESQVHVALHKITVPSIELIKISDSPTTTLHHEGN